tara:strand:- start:3101 stop:3679 length:579 start_codon:yes stop_codon:yes gene_type:complete
MKVTDKLSKKNILIGLLSLVILLLVLGNSNERKLIDKLNDDEVLIDKFIDFSADGYERKTNLSKNKIESVIDTAMTYLGTPNKVGGTNKDSIDASGLVYVSINKNFDIKFPRIAQDMARYGKMITNPKKLKRGDLVFFFDTYDVNRIITSVGLYLGEGSFLNSSTKDGVSESDINDPYYWKEKFFFGTRIFK